jgi:hypothetical protein
MFTIYKTVSATKWIKIFFLSIAMITTAMFFAESTAAQINGRSVEGTVSSLEGNPINNAKIFYRTTLVGTTGANDGIFLIENLPDNISLTFSHPDYLSEQVPLTPDAADPSKHQSIQISLKPDTNPNPKNFNIQVLDELNRPVKLNHGIVPKQNFDEIFVTKERSSNGADATGNDWGNIDPNIKIESPFAGFYKISSKNGYRISGNFLEFRKKGYQKNYVYIPDITEDGETYHVTLKTEKIENSYEKNKFLPLSNIGLDPIIKKNILLDAGNDFEPKKNLGSNEYAIQQTFFKRILPQIYRIIGAVGIFYLSIVGVSYIFSNGESDSISKQKNTAIWIVVGLMVISVAEFLGFSIVNPDKNILEGETLPDLQAKTHQIIRYIEYLGGGIFLLNGVLSGYSIIFSTNEEVATNQKKFMVNFALGVLFILSAEIIIRVASNYDGINGTLNIAISEVGSIINFILSFLAGASGFMLILASLYYVANFGNEEQTGRAKKIIIGCITGLVIAFSSYVLAQFLII